jgi:hypothetical protein
MDVPSFSCAAHVCVAVRSAKSNFAGECSCSTAMFANVIYATYAIKEREFVLNVETYCVASVLSNNVVPVEIGSVLNVDVSVKAVAETSVPRAFVVATAVLISHASRALAVQGYFCATVKYACCVSRRSTSAVTVPLCDKPDCVRCKQRQVHLICDASRI